ncbi:MAG: META domain-containing protein [Cytophagales bacterium]|nr:META domain-containing protein [Cytophagales bacterium]
MKRTEMYVVFFIFLLFNTSCKKDNNTLTGKWKLISYEDINNDTITYEPQNISRSIIIEFSDKGKKGKLNGHTVTNSVSGKYKLNDNNKIEVLEFGGTKVAEPEWGKKFWNAIYIVTSYQVTKYNLYLLFNNDTEKMIFEKQ